jgi:transcriptional regulator with XRE-family HTH domain
MSVRSADSLDKYVGTRVRTQRMIAGLSQQDLAAKLGLSFQQLQKYEKGSNRLRASRMHQICEILNVPLSFMYDGQAKTLSGKATALNMMHEFLATRQGLALVKAFQKTECAKCPPECPRPNRTTCKIISETQGHAS